jgi:hypothetical protein
MTSTAQESFKQCRKFKTVKKNAKRWTSKKTRASSSSGPPSKKGKSGAVHMITAFNDEGSAEHTSKKARLASPDIENADQSAVDESDNDPQLAGAASSSKQGVVTSTGPYKKTSEPTSETRPSPVISKRVHRKKLAGKDQKVEEPATSFDCEGSTERPDKKQRTASSASVMHVHPLRSDNDDDHNLLLSTLTGGHGVFMAEARRGKQDRGLVQVG